jgi:multidrug efflux pump subunit AcrA (membrane-fusion protein)
MRKVLINVGLVVAVLLAAGLGAAVMIGNRREPKRSRPAPATVRVLAPPVAAARDHSVRISGYGSARPKVRLEISPRVSGRIVAKSERFLSGRTVRRREGAEGDILFRLDAEPFQLAVDNAKRSLDVLASKQQSVLQERKNLQANERLETDAVGLDKKQLERVQELFGQGVATDNEVEKAEGALLATRMKLQATQNQIALIPSRLAELDAEIAAARVKLRQVELELRYTEVECPVAGRIISSGVEVGDDVQAGKVCGEMYGTEQMEIPVSIPSSELRWLDPAAMRACIEFGGSDENPPCIPAAVEWAEAGTDRVVTWEGFVCRIEAGLEAQTRTATLVVLVDNRQQPPPPAGEAPTLLDLNMYCKVAITGKTIPRAYLLPREAIQNGRFVYLAEKAEEAEGAENKAPPGGEPASNPEAFRLARRDVRIARYTDGTALLLPDGGLTDGDRVILNVLAKPVLGMRLDLSAEEKAENEKRKKERLFTIPNS